MRTMFFTQAVDDALAQAMAKDARIILFGEDVPLIRRDLLVRFGPRRVRGAPISESAFLRSWRSSPIVRARPGKLPVAWIPPELAASERRSKPLTSSPCQQFSEIAVPPRIFSASSVSMIAFARTSECAVRRLSSASGRARSGPRASVSRSSLRSWKTTRAPSLDACTSNST